MRLYKFSPHAHHLTTTLLLFPFATPQGEGSYTSCLFPSSMRNNPAEDLSTAFYNVSCPVNTAYLTLYTFSNSSSVLDSCTAITSTLITTTAYVNATQPMTSEAGAMYYVGPSNDFAFNWQQWVEQFVMNKQTLYSQGVGQKLQGLLTTQRDETKVFLHAVYGKFFSSTRGDAQAVVQPVLGYLDCGIQAFGSEGNSVANCSMSSVVLISTSLPKGSSAVSATTTSDGTQTMTATGSTAAMSSGVGGKEAEMGQGAMVVDEGYL